MSAQSDAIDRALSLVTCASVNDAPAAEEVRTFTTLGGREVSVVLGAPRTTKRQRLSDADRDLSVTVRRTMRNEELLSRGVHPATHRPLLSPVGSWVCAGCVHHNVYLRGNKRVHKCDVHRLGESWSEASDIRVSWPACDRFALHPDLEAGA